MKSLGIWTGEVITPRKPIVSTDWQDVSYLNASTGGLFVPTAAHRQMLCKGEVVGEILDPLEGKVLDTVTSPVDGLLFTIREYPIVDEGSLLGRILAKEVALA